MNQLWISTLRTLYNEPDGSRDCPEPDKCSPAIKAMLEKNLVNVSPSKTSETGWTCTITEKGARAIGRRHLLGALPFMKGAADVAGDGQDKKNG